MPLAAPHYRCLQRRRRCESRLGTHDNQRQASDGRVTRGKVTISGFFPWRQRWKRLKTTNAHAHRPHRNTPTVLIIIACREALP
eukprot:COSAG06_NODE_167_length_21546_cov_35.001352_2_plen_84_part_00